VATTTLGYLPTVVVLRVGTVTVGMVVAEEETVAVVDKAASTPVNSNHADREEVLRGQLVLLRSTFLSALL
jgi:hypothetical protein